MAMQTGGCLPVFVIASPPDMHLAPLAVLRSNPRIAHIILGNGLLRSDIAWLRSQVPGVPVVPLRASLKANARTYLSHAEVIRLCQKASRADFCIQDADCFVIDAEWWNELRFDSAEEYAVGPFYKAINGLHLSMPETYLVLINASAYRRREAGGIQPDIASDVQPVAKLLKARGISTPYFPEAGKDYVDTLQLHWLAATLAGERFRPLPGADQVVFHVGGSTYLTGGGCADVAHWDYWPLNTPYVHLRILEFPRFAGFKPRFPALFQRFGSADKLLADYPGFRQSRRFAGSEKLLAHFAPFLRGETTENRK